jgi:hypothetical protein
MMDSGSKVLKMEEASILTLLLELFTVDSGKRVKKMVKASLNYPKKSTTMAPF